MPVVPIWSFAEPAFTTVAKLKTGLSLLDAAKGNFALGDTVVSDLNLKKLVINEDGTTNLDYYGARVVLSGSRWNNTGSGTWTPLGNWIGAGSPNSSGAVGTFGSVITAAATVTLDSAKTAGVINFDSANAYTIAGANTLTMQSSGTPAINVFAGSFSDIREFCLTSGIDRLKILAFGGLYKLSVDEKPVGFF